MSTKLEQFPLSVPVTFVNHGKGKKRADLIELSLSSSTATCITYWATPTAPTGSEDKAESPATRGGAIGCGDGSIYLLQSSATSNPPPTVSATTSSSPEHVLSPSNARRYIGLGHHPSRPASPSSTKSSLSPFHLTRSRVVSSVTTEQAEAPKNYVDFDEEEEKLRGMLKGKGHRDRHASTSRTRSDTPQEKIPSTQTTVGRSLRKDDTRSYLSALSPTSSTLSLSTSAPPSPPLAPTSSDTSPLCEFALQCHVYPPHTGPRCHVSALKIHNGGRYITCLNAAGGLSVHSSSDGACLASTVIDARAQSSSAEGKSQPAPPMLWVWRTLLVATSEESIILFALASPDELYPVGQFSDTGSDTENQSLMVAYELRLGADANMDAAELEYMGQRSLNAPVNSFGLLAGDDHLLTLFYADPSGHLVSRHLRVLDGPPSPPADLPASHSSTHLPLPNPFKVLKSLSTDHIPDTVEQVSMERIELGDEMDHGEFGLTAPVIGLRAYPGGGNTRILAWSATEMVVATWAGTLNKSPMSTLPGIQDVKFVDRDSFSVLFSDRVEVHNITGHGADENDGSLRSKLSQSVALTEGDAAALTHGGQVIHTHLKNGRRRIHYTSVEPSSTDIQRRTRTLWKARKDGPGSDSEPAVSTLLPLGLDALIIGYADGHLVRSSLQEFTRHSPVPSQKTEISLPGAIVAVAAVQDPRTGERALVGGADDGTLAVWTLDTLKLCARWTLFTTPLARVVPLVEEKIGRLYGCALCVSEDGTIAVIAIDGYQFVYLVPAAASPLTRICLGEDNLMLIYGDGRARLWDTRTREFWRSMSNEKAEELVQQGGWFQWQIGDVSENNVVLSAPPQGTVDARSTLLVDVSALLRQFASSAALAGSSGTGLSAKAKLELARALLSVLLTFGISESIDSICIENLNIVPYNGSVGLTSTDSFSLLPQSHPLCAWTVSPEASADRALAVLSVLQFLTQFEDLAPDATTVMTFYAASVGQFVHEGYQPPSLPRLGRYLLHTLSADVRQAAKLLFDAGIARLSDQETIQYVESWQQYLPVLQPEKERDWTHNALALCICGCIAVDKYTLLPTSTLTDIAKSIAVYLHDETSPHRELAIDLCSRGFQVWQQYVDAVEMLRALFTLATTTKKEAILVPNIGLQARTAVLQIAADNTPLFMTTLAIDILHPRSVQHRKSVMQLVIFLIRKKPLVLYSNLPRLVEAIVKSLDPNSNATREAVLDSATEILSHIVRTFPTVDFHMGSQRLAVGTSEGAVVMYDLKTATRLYVLEGHKKRTTACSFSPDGRRLVTLSLEESDVLVWKVGVSFTSFFMPGAPPRQGHAGSEPFKTLSFNIGDEAHMSLEDTLTNVQFEWTADRNVKLKINESMLTFNT